MNEKQLNKQVKLSGELKRLKKEQDGLVYNQIVGFLVISIDKADVNFNLYKSEAQYRYNVKRTEKSIKYLTRTGDHFYIGNPHSNSELAMRIKERVSYEIDYLKRNHKNYYLDTTLFNAVIDHIDLLSIINKEDASNE